MSREPMSADEKLAAASRDVGNMIRQSAAKRQQAAMARFFGSPAESSDSDDKPESADDEGGTKR